MPLDLESFVNNEKITEVFVWIVQEGIENCDSIYVSDDKTKLHVQYHIKDKISQENIGKIVYKLNITEQHVEMVDVNVIWDNSESILVEFTNKFDGDDYYQVEVVDVNHHLSVLPINEFVVDNVLNKKCKVFVSVLPFNLNIFDNMNELNSVLGFEKIVPLDDENIVISGLSEEFCMSNGMFGEEDMSSFLVGKIISYKDVQISFGKLDFDFVLAHVETGIGIVPVSMSRDIFDLEKLKVNSYLCMNAMVKANMASDGDFQLLS